MSGWLQGQLQLEARAIALRPKAKILCESSLIPQQGT